jgi:hypothetical protein
MLDISDGQHHRTDEACVRTRHEQSHSG